MYQRSPIGSPYARMGHTNSSRPFSGYSKSSGNKSPCTQDRYVFNKSPSRHSSANENIMPDFEMGCRMMNGQATPGTPKIVKNPPRITKVTLDAPEVLNCQPLKVIDVNERDELAVALGTSVYIKKGSETPLLMNGNVDINAVCWVGDHLAISGEGHVELWDVNRQQPLRDFYDHTDRAAALSSFGGNRLATGGADGAVCMFDLRMEEKSMKCNNHRAEVCSLSWAPDGSMLASGGFDNTVYVFDGKKKIRINHEAPVLGLTWLNSGVLVTGDYSSDGVLQEFHIRSGDPNRYARTGSPICGICMTEKWGLIVGHSDLNGTWDIWSPDISKRIQDVPSQCSEILNISANYDGSLVVTISADERLQLFELTQSVLTPSQQSRFVSAQQSPRCTPNCSMRSPGGYGYSSQSSYQRSPGGYGYSGYNLR
ncbi:anaphase promoting complex protein [Tritrichomonas foetus]|uniref:Anaphase promoting complex protein n=1 Tax=Tritrichomonas foetus TaxID=1144522 RepID=A0A1J4K843_9EUKA|nr:anaphase promoting complex protein [Tritrichomonas foetus]|eukprot:OHT05605.1 anaphase promoting complex protein [Tritrichomonas foetus]